MIEWLTKDGKKRKSIENNTWKRFLGCIKKINSIDIVLKNKLKSIYNEKKILFKKKYALNFCAVCSFSIWFIYIYIG